MVDKTGENALFLGDGVAPLRARIEERLGSRAQFVSAQHMNLRAGSACALAAKLAETDEQAVVDYIHLLPLYLRAPQAERERAAREGKQNG